MGSKGYWKRGLWLGALALVLVSLWFLATRSQPLAVTLHTVAKGEVEATVANTRAGSVRACRRALLAPGIGGQVDGLLVKEGQQVEQGQLLLELWNEDLKARLTLARAELAVAQAGQEEVCLLAKAEKRELKRLKALGKLASAEQKDRAETQTQAAQIACRAAEARVQTAQASIASAQAALERTRLRAPFTGWVAQINGEVGEFVTPSPPGIPTPAAVDLIDTSCLYIKAPIDEVDVPRVVPGMEARITLDAFPGRAFLGGVRRVAPVVTEIEKQARTVDVEAVFMIDEDYQSLMPGYSADLEVILDRVYEVVRIPSEALLEGDRVYVYDGDLGSVHLREVKTGLANWRFTEIQAGLNAGERIVLSIEREGLAEGALVTEEAGD